MQHRGSGRHGRYRDRSPDFDRRRSRDDSLDRYEDGGERDDDRSRYRRDRSPDDRFRRGGEKDRYGDGRRRRYRSRSRSRSRSPSPYGRSRERKYSRDEGHGSSKRQSRWGASAPTSASVPISQPGFSQYGPSAGSTTIPPPPPRTQQPVGTRVFAQPVVAPPNAYGRPTAAAPIPGLYGPVASAPSTAVYGAAPVPGMVPGTVNPYPVSVSGIPGAGAIPGQYGQVPAPPPPAAAAAVAIPGLDLASLASQAQQALSSIQGIPPAAPAAPQQPQFANSPPKEKQITETDLPMMVQYALQNLQTTGHIDGMLDPGICRMLQTIPEAVALEALQKFQSCETGSMRNKNAYLGGIIKRKREEAGVGGR